MMGWTIGSFGAGCAVLVLWRLIGMGLLMWLPFRPTGDSWNRVGVQPPRHALDQPLREDRIETDSYSQARIGRAGVRRSRSAGPGWPAATPRVR